MFVFNMEGMINKHISHVYKLLKIFFSFVIIPQCTYRIFVLTPVFILLYCRATTGVMIGMSLLYLVHRITATDVETKQQ